MTLYRIGYFKDVEQKERVYTHEFDDFQKMKKQAKKLAELTGRPIQVEWSYSILTPGAWTLLRYCPNAKDVNNLKEKH